LVGRIPKHRLGIVIDQDDYLWAAINGFEFSKRFSEYLKMVRREVEAATLAVIIFPRGNSPPSSQESTN
jgi:hypothetical protein